MIVCLIDFKRFLEDEKLFDLSCSDLLDLNI